MGAGAEILHVERRCEHTAVDPDVKTGGARVRLPEPTLRDRDVAGYVDLDRRRAGEIEVDDRRHSLGRQRGGSGVRWLGVGSGLAAVGVTEATVSTRPKSRSHSSP